MEAGRGPGAGTQAGGVQLKPNNGRPENQLPYTPFGLELSRSHKALEGTNAVLPAQDNDLRNCANRSGCRATTITTSGSPRSSRTNKRS